MFQHLNPSELQEAEPLEGEIIPKMDPNHFPEKTDIEMFASQGHVIFAQTTNFLKVGMFIVPACLLTTTLLVGAALHGVRVPDVWTLFGYEIETVEVSPRSFLGSPVYELIGFDPDTAVSLPDGQQVHGKLAWMQERILEAKADKDEEAIEDEDFEADGAFGYPRDEAAEAEAKGDEMLAAWDRGEDPAAFGFEDDYEGQQQMAEDAYLRDLEGHEDEGDRDGDAEMRLADHFENPGMPIEMEFGRDEDEHERTYEMAPVDRYEDKDREKDQSQDPVPERHASKAILIDEFSTADRHRLDDMEGRVDTAMTALKEAKASGDTDAINTAREGLAEANGEFKDYLSDRQEYKARLVEVRNDAERLITNETADRQSTAQDFKESYSQANQSIDRMEQQGKPWAQEMRRDLRESGLEYHQEDRERQALKPDSGDIPESMKNDVAEKYGVDLGQKSEPETAKPDREVSIAGVMNEADEEREGSKVQIDVPSPSVIASYQAQYESDRHIQG